MARVEPTRDSHFWNGILGELADINRRVEKRRRDLSWRTTEPELDRRGLSTLPFATIIATVTERRDAAIIREWEQDAREMPVKADPTEATKAGE
jgi:hypothetical protein